MSAQVQLQPSASVQLVPLAPFVDVATVEEDILPPPAPLDRGQIEDAMTMLYMLINARSRDDLASTQEQIAAQKTVKEEALHQELAALQRAAEADGEGSKGFFESLGALVTHAVEDLVTFDILGSITDPWEDLAEMGQSPKFWQDLQAGAGVIAQVALIAGAAAAIIATGGAAGPVIAGIACAVSAGGMVVEKTECLDGVLGEDASKWVGFGMQVAGCVTGAGALTFAGGAAASGAWLGTMETATKAGAGAATLVKGAAIVKTGEFRADADHARADALTARHQAERMTRLVQQLLDGIAEMSSSHQRAKETLNETIQVHDQAQVTAIFTTGRQS